MWHLAWRNVTRRPERSLMTLVITILTIFSFVTALSIYMVLNDGLARSTERLGADILLLPNSADADATETLFTGVPVNAYMPSAVLAEASAFDGVRSVTPQFFSHTLSGGCCSLLGTVRLAGFDPATDFLLTPNLAEGAHSDLAPREVLVGSSVSLPADEPLEILGETFTVAGRLLPTGSGMDETLFMRLDTARALSAGIPELLPLWEGQAPDAFLSAVLIRADDGADIDRLAKTLDRKIRNVQAVTVGETVRTAREQVRVITTMLLTLWGSSLLIAALALIGRYESSVRDRRREIGLMRAHGVQRSEILRLVLLEACLLSGIGGLIGGFGAVLAATPILSAITGVFHLPAGIWTLGSAIGCWGIGLIAALLLGFAAAIHPAAVSAALDPQEAIAKGALH